MSTRSCGKGLCQVPNRPGLPKAGTRWSMRRIRAAVRGCGGLCFQCSGGGGRGVVGQTRPHFYLTDFFSSYFDFPKKGPSSKSWLPFSCWCLGQKRPNPPRSDILAVPLAGFVRVIAWRYFRRPEKMLIAGRSLPGLEPKSKT